jgi:type IV secretory pathway TrbF-like protein
MKTILLEAAWNIAKTELRYRDRGKDEDAERAHARMMQVVYRTENPEEVLLALAERLGALRS